ncbi:MAG: hypothetical protein IPO09_16650 [Anaeromyxobacter sp.]|nr:hypothetical protein [Anaeromyxobacter sp.]MBL0276237.1 hypothetical protein [Anaeromyxobacter sp.]
MSGAGGAAGGTRRSGEGGRPLGGEIAAALDEARQLEQRARRLVLLARVHGGEAATQAWADELARESARSRSAVLARLEHGDPLGALRVALTLVDTVRAHGFDAYAQTLEAMALARGQAGQA